METGAKAFPDFTVTLHTRGEESHPEPGLTRRVLAHNDKHGASAIEDSLLIDVFTPCRQDYVHSDRG